MNKGFADYLAADLPDLVALQETKMQPEQLEGGFDGYQIAWNSAERKGYSGTAVLYRRAPLAISRGIGLLPHDTEGRVLTLTYPSFYFVCCYTPNAQDGLARLPYRLEWEEAFLAYLRRLDADKPVVLCGDLNVAHEEIDLKNARSNRGSAGFTDEERACMTRLLQNGFTDTFRCFYPDLAGAYSWWSYRFHARENNAGWRIDYFIVSDRLLPKVKDSIIRSDVFGSDHCPVSLILEEL